LVEGIMAALALRVASSDLELAPVAERRPAGPILYAVEPHEERPVDRKPQYRWEISPVDGTLFRAWR
jgi:hypothetical protein